MSMPPNRRRLADGDSGTGQDSGGEGRKTPDVASVKNAGDHASETVPESNLAGVTTVSDSPTYQAAGAGNPSGTEAGKTFADERYRVIGLHARGGIGQVLLAVDSELSREVALKEILPGLADDEASRRRFLLEAEITGRLEHPGVVPVYALGKSADDRPFYVMRFIRGESLKEAIEAFHLERREKSPGQPFRSLAFRQLLHRFMDVCDTIAYAHSRGILHRDLKPSNVMLGNYGETLVVDWGLAKVIGRQDPSIASEATLRPQSGSGFSETQAGIAIGTPAFMSPEQADGRLDAIGTASDIYGLGATLYAILTGKPPFTELTLDRLLAKVRTGDFAPPRNVEPGVPHALDAICRKAMSLSPVARYEKADDLAREIEHWLADEPVGCYREPFLTRASRWGRRHKTGVAASVIFLTMATLMLGAGTILLTQANGRIAEERRLADMQKVIAQRQRDLARENFDKARGAVNSYLTLVKDEPLLNRPGLESVRQNLLRSALPYYEDFIRQRGDDPSLRLELAEAYRLTGEITGQIDTRANARKRLERSVQLFEQILASDPNAKQTEIGLARALVSIAYFEVFDDDRQKAESSTDRAIVLLEKLTAQEGSSAEFGRLLGRAFDLKSINRSLEGDLASAVEISEKAIDRLESTARAFPNDGQTKRILARTLNNNAATQLLIGSLDNSLKAFERSAAMLKTLLAEDPEDVIATVSLARVMTNIARVHISLGRFSLSLVPTGEAMTHVRKLLSNSPEMNEYIGLDVDLEDRAALCLAELGRTKQARERVRKCLGREAEITAKGVLNDDLRETFADAWWTQALIEARDGDDMAAEISFDKADSYFEKLLSDATNHNFASQRSGLHEDRIRYRTTPADPQAAETRIAQLRAIVADRESRLAAGTDPDSRRTELARGLVTLSEALMARDGPKFDPASLARALKLIDQVAGSRPNSLEIRRIEARARSLLARHLATIGKAKDSESEIDLAIEIASRAADEDPAYLYDLASMHAAAAALRADNEAADADSHKSRAIAALKKAVDSGYDDIARLRVDPGMAPIRDVPAFQNLLNSSAN